VLEKYVGPDKVAEEGLAQLFWAPAGDKILMHTFGYTGLYDVKADRLIHAGKGMLLIFGGTPVRPDGAGFLVMKNAMTWLDNSGKGKATDPGFVFLDWDGKERPLQAPALLLDAKALEKEKDANKLAALLCPALYDSGWEKDVAQVSWNVDRLRYLTGKGEVAHEPHHAGKDGRGVPGQGAVCLHGRTGSAPRPDDPLAGQEPRGWAGPPHRRPQDRAERAAGPPRQGRGHGACPIAQRETAGGARGPERVPEKGLDRRDYRGQRSGRRGRPGAGETVRRGKHPTERDINCNFAYDYEAYGQVKRKKEGRMSDFTSQIPAARSASQPVEPRAASAAPRQLRLWPAVVIVALQWTVMVVPVLVARDNMLAMMMAKMGAPLLGFLGLALWWLFASRLRWRDRLLGLVACVGLGAAAYPFNHPTFDLFPLIMIALPVLTTAWVLWLVLTPYLSWPVRRAGLVVVFALVWIHFTQVRFDGVWGSFAAELSYRWVPTGQQNFEDAVRTGKIGVAENVSDQPLVLATGDWPGFRGPDRDARRTGLRIATDWEKNPPRELWKHQVGAGWSSFAVVGNRLFTQMQWDLQNEATVCYDAETGKQIWVHKDAARFSEKLGGDGPRATPTFNDGKVYALGATGRLNCLDAVTGRVLWAHDILADSGAKLPMWGFCSSPLVVQGVVSVFAGGEGGKSVLGVRLPFPGI